MKNFFLTYIFLLLSFSTSFSQTNEINEGLKYISEGNIDNAKLLLPELLAKYPNDPGVKYLHAVVLEDGSLALSIYKEIISKFPKSPWVEESYLRIIQYYSITGDTLEAKKYFSDFKKLFSNSDYLPLAENAVKVAVNQKRKNTAIETLNEIPVLSQKKDEKLPKTESDNQNTKKPVEEKEQTPSKLFSLQVGIYSTQTAAKNEVEKFTKLRLVASIYPKKIGSETLYAVIIGEYKTRQLAENAKPIVAKHCNCIPIIIEK
ncbi:hypothetical protein D9V86_01930 [Bacteroidetes/Chlorobi group bacterium ChocPot_Mid]|jgi:tetratricopeptide (TPR) repeat protein|nr:MAG: hypothetical protein D9V86_01930 [Bacteroidetes/Chlorobi group bacterium ChocPot_Mid]